MNKEEINYWLEIFEKTRHSFMSKDGKILSFYDTFKTMKDLQNNWNKLKKWLEKELGDRINPNKDKWLTGVYDAYRETIDKMQELEQGSDSNERRFNNNGC